MKKLFVLRKIKESFFGFGALCMKGFYEGIILINIGTSYLPSVASKCVHVRKKHVLLGCKHDMFCRQTCEVWGRRLLST